MHNWSGTVLYYHVPFLYYGMSTYFTTTTKTIKHHMYGEVSSVDVFFDYGANASVKICYVYRSG